MKVTNPLGLVFTFTDSGAVSSVEADPIRISLRPLARFARAGANVYLRERGNGVTYTPLLGAHSPARFRSDNGCFEARGSWGGLDFQCLLQLADARLDWRWTVRVDSKLDRPVELDLIYVQDVGLRASAAGLVNEAYVSQYLERRVFHDPQRGAVICCRQNMRESVGHPWLMIACAGRAAAASTDGLQFYGPRFRATAQPEALGADLLPGELAAEASVVALQTAPFRLEPAQSHTSAFVARYVPDHPAASSSDDLVQLPELVRGFVATAPPPATGALLAPAPHRFARAPLLPAEDLTDAELDALFEGDRRHVEEADGRLLSFFTDGPRHVVLREKELRVDRPHGHIMQANCGYVPDEAIMSTTAFACGVFNSHLTQGNTNFNGLLSICTNPATPALEGQRIFVQLADGEYLLGVPSAFEMGCNHCRWIYKHGPLCLQVCTWTAMDEPRVQLELTLLRGGPVSVALTHELDAENGWTISPDELVARPSAHSLLAGKFPGAQFRLLVDSGDPAQRAYAADRGWFVIEAQNISALRMCFVGDVMGAAGAPARARLIPDADAQRRSDCAAAASAWRVWSRELALSGPESIGAIREILPWYGMNALVHFLTPYGLEQFSGAAWGTRDVCQGPIELLLSLHNYAEARQVLCSVFAHQNPDGGWPQWWMFDRYRSVRADSAHGDVVYWCILALCSYIRASGDFAILDEPLPYYSEAGSAPRSQAAGAALREHVERTIELVVSSFVPGTALVQFGGGDWNDSLQPVSRELARRLISSWTVQMCYQALAEYRQVCERIGDAKQAERLEQICQRILADFHRHLVRDGVVAGYGLVCTGQRHGIEGIDVLLHPTDTMTGVRYSLLPMNRGVLSGMFSLAQAERHLSLIEQHLKGPDGARLMDRPLRYHGGPQSIFQRAESSTYFGREIGLMYVHEHLRYAQVQAHMGKPDALLRALRQASPVDYTQIVAQGDLRQANCYYSSSDVMFRTRYEADERYQDVVAGKLPLKGGWRVYSSGPGIYVALVVSRLLGLRIEYGKLIIDPVLARSLDGLRAGLRLRDRPVSFVYRVADRGFGPRAITVNGRSLAFEREHNPYRVGGAVVPIEHFVSLLEADENRVEIDV